MGFSCSLTIVSGTRLYVSGGPRPGACKYEAFLNHLVRNAAGMVLRKLDATEGETIPEERITAFIKKYSQPMPRT